jgi:hypothetical protein
MAVTFSLMGRDRGVEILSKRRTKITVPDSPFIKGDARGIW